jgi:hypothetical protein
VTAQHTAQEVLVFPVHAAHDGGQLADLLGRQGREAVLRHLAGNASRHIQADHRDAPVSAIKEDIPVQMPILTPIAGKGAAHLLFAQRFGNPGVQDALLDVLKHFQPHGQGAFALIQALDDSQLAGVVGRIVVEFSDVDNAR